MVVGVVLVVVGLAGAQETGTAVSSFSLGIVGLGAVAGLVAGIADFVEPLRELFERGRWVIVGLAVFALLVVTRTESAGPQVIEVAVGFGVGAAVAGLSGIGLTSLPRQESQS